MGKTKKNWYVTWLAPESNDGHYDRRLAVGPFRTKLEAATQCARLKPSADDSRINPGPGFFSLGIEKVAESCSGYMNAVMGLPVEPLDAHPDSLAAVEYRLTRLPCGVPGWELWEGSEEDCLALAKAKGLKTVGGRQSLGGDCFRHELAGERGHIQSPRRTRPEWWDESWTFPQPWQGWRLALTGFGRRTAFDQLRDEHFSVAVPGGIAEKLAEVIEPEESP